MRTALVGAVMMVICGVAVSVPAAGQARASDDDIRQLMIEQSIAAYPGSCPCPYSAARNGSGCGARSAYSRPGGRSPLCYAKDITSEMVNAYRRARDSK